MPRPRNKSLHHLWEQCRSEWEGEKTIYSHGTTLKFTPRFAGRGDACRPLNAAGRFFLLRAREADPSTTASNCYATSEFKRKTPTQIAAKNARGRRRWAERRAT